jgi:hypothetical protein
MINCRRPAQTTKGSFGLRCHTQTTCPVVLKTRLSRNVSRHRRSRRKDSCPKRPVG